MSGFEHPTWEYRIDSNLSETALNGLGADGWELVAVDSRGGSARFYLKRPGLDFREQVTLDQKRRYYARLPNVGDDGPEEQNRPDRAADAR